MTIVLEQLDASLQRFLEEESKRSGLDLPQLVKLLLRDASARRPRLVLPEDAELIGNRLDRFIGGWTAEDQAEFDKATEWTRQIDEEM